MNMMFPKPTKKKRKKHKKSIMQPKGDRRCYLCMLLDGDFTYKPYLEEHHVLFGNTHAFAEAEGLKVNLCLEHHRNGPAAVHNNAKNARILMAKAQALSLTPPDPTDLLEIAEDYQKEVEKIKKKQQAKANMRNYHSK